MTSNVIFNGNLVLLVTIVLVVFLIGLIYGFRWYFSKKAKSDLTHKYENVRWGEPLRVNSKYPEVDVFRFHSLFFKLALAVSLSLIVLAFNWTSFEKEVVIPENALDIDSEIEIEPPRTLEKPPPPPPPPPPIIQEVAEALILEEDEPVFIDQDITEETFIEAPEPEKEEKAEEAPPPPPPPPPPAEDLEEIFRVVEQRPRFPGCEDMAASNTEKEACANQKLLEYIYSNLRYPQIAVENGIEGTVVIEFVVSREGKIENANIIRDIGAGCGDAAKKVVDSMNEMPEKWNPGKQRGRPVKVLFVLPVKFQILNS